MELLGPAFPVELAAAAAAAAALLAALGPGAPVVAGAGVPPPGPPGGGPPGALAGDVVSCRPGRGGGGGGGDGGGGGGGPNADPHFGLEAPWRSTRFPFTLQIPCMAPERSATIDRVNRWTINSDVGGALKYIQTRTCFYSDFGRRSNLDGSVTFQEVTETITRWVPDTDDARVTDFGRFSLTRGHMRHVRES